MSVKNMFSSFSLVEEVKRLYKMLDNDVTFSAQMHLYFVLLSSPRLVHACVALILRNLNVKFYIVLCGNGCVCFLIFHGLKNHSISCGSILSYINNRRFCEFLIQ